ncbi:MAG TPA: ABC transporter permease [Candidatus Acetothermia bacterium]|nr:MAG: D,D-dipeptide ABC transporter permease [Deltaproteobacteria bacterium]HDJ29578.1 ABC transporter permease [Candidatus Acetothermia bacterium]
MLGSITWRDFTRHMLKNRLSLVGLILIAALFIIAVIGPYLAPYGPYTTDPINKLEGPSRVHLFGTDNLGRDLLSRILYGARISVTIAVIVLAVSGGVGTVIGIISGYFGGGIDNILMRITDIFLAFPRLILAMAVAAALGRDLRNVVLAVAFTSWTIFARLARGQALAVKQQDYVEAARATGASNFRILFVHVLPVCISPVIIQGTIAMGGIILTVAGLGFIGFGAQPPTPEWGVMVADGRNYLPTAWWACVFPGLAIMFTVLGFNLLGDGIRDILDPRMRR